MRISDWSSDVCSSNLSVAVAGRLVQVGFECVSRKYLALECGQRWLAVRVDGGCARTPLIQFEDIGDLAQGHEQLEPRLLGRAAAGTTRDTREIYDGRAGVRVGGWDAHEVQGERGAVRFGALWRHVEHASFFFHQGTVVALQ